MSGEFLLAISILLVICVFFFLFRFRFKIEIKDGVLYTRFFFKTNSINLDNVNEFIIINEGITELVHGNGVFKVYPIVKNHEKLMNELESVLGLKPKHIKK